MSKTQTLEKPKHEPVFIPAELYAKLEDHAKQKGVTVDQEATELVELAIKVLDVHVAAKRVMKGGDEEL